MLYKKNFILTLTLTFILTGISSFVGHDAWNDGNYSQGRPFKIYEYQSYPAHIAGMRIKAREPIRTFYYHHILYNILIYFLISFGICTIIFYSLTRSKKSIK